MDLTWPVALAALLGLLVGAAAAAAFRVSEDRQRARPEPTAPAPAVDDDVAALLTALAATSVLLGSGDEVLRVSPDAYSSGLVRNGRITSREVSDLVDRARREGTAVREQVTTARSSITSDRSVLDVTVAPFSGGRVLVLTEDRTAAQRVEEVRRDFVANVSHELKTPVGALSLLAETVDDAADDPETVRRFSRQMQTEATRLASLVRDIVDLSRLQAPDVELELVEVAVDDVIVDAVDRVQVGAAARSATITVGGERGLRVWGDASMLVTAVRNLLDNALRYSPDGGQVNVGVRSRDGLVHVAVVDQGVGISAADAVRVFERFYRVDPARSRETGGTGLGLSIVKHVAGRHGGDVRLWSTPGQGSTFTLRIPLVEAASSTTGTDGTDGESGTDGTAGTDGAGAGRAGGAPGRPPRRQHHLQRRGQAPGPQDEDAPFGAGTGVA